MTDKIYYISNIRNILGAKKPNFHLLKVVKINADEVEEKHKLLETLSDAVNWFYEHTGMDKYVSPSEWRNEINIYISKHITPLIEEHKKGEFEGYYWVPADKYEIGQVLEKIPEDFIHTNLFETKDI